MKKNIGPADRIARLVFAAALVIPYFMGKLDGTIGIVALVVAAVMVVTSLVSFCPVYTIIGALFGGNGADEDPHKSGMCCGKCGGEDSDVPKEANDGPPILK
jgi:hypothetical protein